MPSGYRSVGRRLDVAQFIEHLVDIGAIICRHVKLPVPSLLQSVDQNVRKGDHQLAHVTETVCVLKVPQPIVCSRINGYVHSLSLAHLSARGYSLPLLFLSCLTQRKAALTTLPLDLLLCSCH